MVGGTWVLAIFAYTYGSVVNIPDAHFQNEAACKQVKAKEEKRLEKILPESYHINAVCKPIGGYSLRELAGKNGWDCYKHGKCHADEPDITIKIEVERQ
jgi:hypothetical protein